MKYSQDEEKLFARMAHNSREFVVVLGAGASMPAGLPGWEELRDTLIKTLENHYIKTGMEEVERNKRLKTVKQKDDLWDSFAFLRDELHKTDYVETVIQALSTRDKVTPEIYELLWDLGISGIVTYNLDDFSDKRNEPVKHQPIVAHWNEALKYANLLHYNSPFVFHPHGMLNDPDSWVLTRRDKDSVYKQASFRVFMTALINTKFILIVGFNPDDQSFLDLLDDISINPESSEKTIYYMYPSVDTTISLDINNKFADYGICAIPYNCCNNHIHLNDFLKNMRKQQKQLQSEVPNYSLVRYEGAKFTVDDIPTPTETWRHTYDELRRIMSGAVSSIISHDEPRENDMDMLRNFYNEYSEQLHVAWHINPNNSNREANKLFGYTLEQRSVDEIKRGSFGRVYESHNDDGERFAIKVLSPEVTSEDNYLNCFRRGVRTMKILSDKKLKGIVKFCEAFEVPACIVMEYVDGLTLREAIEQKAFSHSANEFVLKLKLILDIARIVNSAHVLEERVLHRDLKPENIILEDFYGVNDDYDHISVKIVDFDLSWHRGAQGLTVAATGSAGFVAPEQLPGQSRDKTKDALVDVYSIGMLLFYILAEHSPLPNQHEFKSFREDISDVFTKIRKFKWQTTRRYITDLIIDSTKQNQSERTPLSSFISRIETVIKMESGSSELPSSHELLAYELAARIDKSMEIEAAQNGIIGDIVAHQRTLQKTYAFKRIYENNRYILLIEIVKQHAGEVSGSNIVEYTKRATNRAQGKVDKLVFQKSKIDWETRAITANLLTQLPERVSINLVDRIVKNLVEISLEMRFTN